MKKSDLTAQEQVYTLLDKAAETALLNGAGAKQYGIQTGADLGDIYTVEIITHTTQKMKPTAMPQEAWDGLTESEKEKQGQERNWFSFKCPEGNLSFATIMGDRNSHNQEFFDDKDFQTVDDFSWDKAFTPSARTAEAWYMRGCDGIKKGSKLRCIAKCDYKSDRAQFATKYRIFELIQPE